MKSSVRMNQSLNPGGDSYGPYGQRRTSTASHTYR